VLSERSDKNIKKRKISYKKMWLSNKDPHKQVPEITISTRNRDGGVVKNLLGRKG